MSNYRRWANSLLYFQWASLSIYIVLKKWIVIHVIIRVYMPANMNHWWGTLKHNSYFGGFTHFLTVKYKKRECLYHKQNKLQRHCGFVFFFKLSKSLKDVEFSVPCFFCRWLSRCGWQTWAWFWKKFTSRQYKHQKMLDTSLIGQMKHFLQYLQSFPSRSYSHSWWWWNVLIGNILKEKFVVCIMLSWLPSWKDVV